MDRPLRIAVIDDMDNADAYSVLTSVDIILSREATSRVSYGGQGARVVSMGEAGSYREPGCRIAWGPNSEALSLIANHPDPSGLVIQTKGRALSRTIREGLRDTGLTIGRLGTDFVSYVIWEVGQIEGRPVGREVERATLSAQGLVERASPPLDLSEDEPPTLPVDDEPIAEPDDELPPEGDEPAEE